MEPVLFGGHVTKALNSLQCDEGIHSCVPLLLPPELKVVKPYQPIWFIGAGPGDPSLLTLKAAEVDRKSTRLNSSHSQQSRMPSSA